MAHPIIPYLSELVKRYILSGNLAAKSFARDVGVPYMVVYRLTRGHQKSVSFFQAKKILKRIEPASYLEILGQYFPDETSELISKGPDIEDSSDELLELVEYAFSDFDHYRVFNFATESLGAKREDVAMEFGRLGLDIVDDMVERKAIRIREDGTYQSMLSDVNVWDEDISVKVCQNNLRLFSSVVPASYLRNWALGLNDNGIRKYYEAHTNFVKSLKDIENDITLRGEQVVFSSVLTGQLHATSQKSEGNKI